MIRKKTVICIFIIFFLIVMFCLNFSKEEYNDDLAKEIPWNQLSNNYKFNIIEFNSNTYNYGESIVNNDILDKLLIEKEIKTYVHNKRKGNMTRSAGRYRPIWEGDFALC